MIKKGKKCVIKHGQYITKITNDCKEKAEICFDEFKELRKNATVCKSRRKKSKFRANVGVSNIMDIDIDINKKNMCFIFGAFIVGVMFFIIVAKCFQMKKKTNGYKIVINDDITASDVTSDAYLSGNNSASNLL